MRLIELPEITDAVPIDQLTPEQLKELQKALAVLGYPVGDIDGLYGPKTRNAWAEYKTDVYHGNPNFIGPESIEKLQEQLTDAGESRYHDFSTKQGTIEAIKAECALQGIGLKTQISYVLATTQWETAQTFRPVKEAYWLSEDWRKNNLRYFPYYGRGYVQLTWEKNYEKYSRILGVDLVSEPDRALNTDIALFVLVHGFKTGAFTGRKITDYIDENSTDFVNARRCINGRDHANDIARIAENFLEGL